MDGRVLACLALLFVAALPVGTSEPTPRVWLWSDPASMMPAPGLDAPDGPGPPAELAQASAWLSTRDLPFHVYDRLDIIAFVATAAQADALRSRVGGRVDLAGEAELHLDKSMRYIGADEVREAVGSARDGPSVLVVDTGVDSAHPDFQSGNLVANVQPERSGGLVLGTIEQIPVVDLAGHGTHVASIVGGSGEALGNNDRLHGDYEGAYSAGRMVSYQAATIEDDDEEIGVDIVAALEAFDWAIANRGRFDIRVVTNSWGVTGAFDPDHPVNQASLRLYLRGMTVVFSAGNEGEDGSGTLNSYCQAPWVLCVAAGDLDGQRVGFSSYGRPDGQAEVWEHPDITAPGLTIRAASPVSKSSPSRTVTGIATGDAASEELYVDRSGTSMAAPHVAGAAALLQAAYPDLSPDQVMDILVASARPMSDELRKVGAGYLDVAAAHAVALEADGNRDAFLAGREVKYAGPATGDPLYANDPVTVGYEGAIPPSALRLPSRDAVWAATPLAWALLGLATVLLLASVGWRRRAPVATAG